MVVGSDEALPSQNIGKTRPEGGGSGRRSRSETIARAKAKEAARLKAIAEAKAREAARLRAIAAAKAARAKALEDFNRRIAETKRRLARQTGPKPKITEAEEKSLIAREELRLEAASRGRGFSRTELQQFLKSKGGSITSLRSAKKKGFVQKRLLSPREAFEELQEKRRLRVGEDITSRRVTSNLTKYIQRKPKTFFAGLTFDTRKEIEKLAKKNKKTFTEQAVILGFEAAIPVQEALTGIVAIPGMANELRKDPRLIKDVPKNIITGFKDTGLEITALAKVDKRRAFARIGGEVFVLWASGKAIKVGGKVTGKIANKINPFLKKVKGGRLIIRTTRGRTTLRVGGSVKKISESLSKQASLAGKRVTAVSAQADELINLIRTKGTGKRIIRKPIPGEAKFAPNIKRLLKRFDEGTITKKQLIRLQSKVPVLERSFFADPRGRFRPSRLAAGVQRDANILDIIKGDFTFKTPKPQILVFENVNVAKFPGFLDDISRSLKSGKTLTKSQAKRLLNWQSKKSGKFKPVGALSREPEITLAPGEIIKKVKRRGTALINGKRVSIVEVKIIKPSKITSQLIKKSKTGKITGKQLKELGRRLKKESGFKSSISTIIKRVKRVKRIKPKPKTKIVGFSQSKLRRSTSKLKRKFSKDTITKRGLKNLNKQDEFLRLQKKFNANKITNKELRRLNNLESFITRKFPVKVKVKPKVRTKIVGFSQSKLRRSTSKLKRKFSKDTITDFGLKNLNKQDEFLRLQKKFNANKITNKELRRLNNLESFITRKFPIKVKVKVEPRISKVKRTSISKGRKKILIQRRTSRVKPKARLPKRLPKRLKPKARPRPRAKPRIKPRARPRTRKRVTRARPRARPKGRPKARPPKRPTKRPPKRPPRRPPKGPPKGPPGKPPVTPKKTRKKRRPKRRKRKQGYNVFARPLKRSKKSKIPKLVKVNKVPLRKSKAKDVRNYVTDTSLARTAAIKKARGKVKKSRLKVPAGYAKKTRAKFRRHRIVKGKRKPLPKGKVIERRKRLLDTRQEKRKITLRRRIKQITKKPVKRKQPVRKAPQRKQARKPVRRSPQRTPVRKPQRRQVKGKVANQRRDQMLKNLAKARRVRAANLRKAPKRRPTPKRKPIKRRKSKRR